jgi:hypothetical protein
LIFSLAEIQATDLLGRLQFNAPLPQSIQPAQSDLGHITPSQVSLNPQESITITVAFDTTQNEVGLQ